MILILDGTPEYVAHAYREIGLIEEKIQFETALDLANALNRLNKRDCSLRVHLILSYRLI